MKKVQYTVAVAGMFFFILAILITSFQLAIYGDSNYRFYEKEYEKYNVTEALGMKMEDVMTVTGHMMDYLIGDEQELSVTTKIEGTEQDFFNEQDRAHMADVKELFSKGLKFRIICLEACFLMIGALYLMKRDATDILLKSYTISLVLFLTVTIFLGVLFVSDFTKYFTIFHELFFTNDLWIFDPETDYMIRMLPEGFFFNMVIRIGVCFIGMLAVVWAGLCFLSSKKFRRINKQEL